MIALGIGYRGITPLFRDEFAAKAYLKKTGGVFPLGGYQIKCMELKTDETYETILTVTVFNLFEDDIAWDDGDF